MPYIDYAYFTGIYGENAISQEEFATIAQLASDVIDSVTRYQIVEKGGLTALSEFVQELVKKAAAAEVEYISTNGGIDTFVSGNFNQGFTVGKVSVSGGGDSQSSAHNLTSPAVQMYLEQTGLMRRGIAIF